MHTECTVRLVIVPGGAQNHMWTMTILLANMAMATALRLLAEAPCITHDCVRMRPCSHPMAGLRAFRSREESPRNEPSPSFLGREKKSLHWVSSSLRQWRAGSNTSERIRFHFFSSHFTFWENCIFMSVNSQGGTR